MRFRFIGCEVLAREFYLLAAQVDAAIDPVLLPIGLHNEPAGLRARLQQEIDRAEEDAGYSYDAILLGYALCSNGSMGLNARRAPLVIPRGHDCITLILGSKETYREYFDAHRGIYWYSAGWIERSVQPGRERWELTYSAYAEKYGEDNADYLMEMEQSWFKEYQWATYINWDLPSAAHDRVFTRECAEFLGWNFDEVQGDQRLLRDFLRGQWDDQRFLVVQPGRYIEPSYDASILRACAECPCLDDAAASASLGQANVLRR